MGRSKTQSLQSAPMPEGGRFLVMGEKIKQLRSLLSLTCSVIPYVSRPKNGDILLFPIHYLLLSVDPQTAQLRLKAQNFQATVESQLEVITELLTSEMAIALPAYLLLSVFKKLPDCDSLKFVIFTDLKGDISLSIYYSDGNTNGHFTLPGRPKDFLLHRPRAIAAAPPIRIQKPSKTSWIAADWQTLISSCLFSASTDQAQPALACISLDATDDVLSLTTTNSYTLASVKRQISPVASPMRGLLPSEFAYASLAIPPNEQIRIILSDEALVLESASFSMECSLQQQYAYPDTEQIFNDFTTRFSFEFEGNLWRSKLQRISVLGLDGQGRARMRLQEPSHLEITIDTKVIDATEVFPIQNLSLPWSAMTCELSARSFSDFVNCVLHVETSGYAHFGDSLAMISTPSGSVRFIASLGRGVSISEADSIAELPAPDVGAAPTEDEPVDEPVIDEPVIDEPVIDEPVIERPDKSGFLEYDLDMSPVAIGF